MLKYSGFTLLEVIIAVVILSIGVITITWAFSTGLFVSTDVENVDLALNIAQAKMEEIKNTAFGSISNSGPTPDPNFSRFNVTVGVTDVVANQLKQVDIMVSWEVKGGSASAVLTTLRTNY